jgi:hypothetical protein
VGELLQFLGDVLGNMMSGHQSKSRFMRWLERAVMVNRLVTAMQTLPSDQKAMLEKASGKLFLVFILPAG